MSFLGMRGTDDWVTDQRPMNWRQQILYIEPNGMAPLTAMLSMMGEERVDDPEFYWWEYLVGHVTGAVAQIWTLPNLTVAYVAGGAAGDTLYLQVTAAVAGLIRIGHQLLLRDASDHTVDVNAKVTAVDINGGNSVIAVKLLEADDNSTIVPANNLSDCDNLMVIGNINPEGGQMPDPVLWDPTKIYNKCQIFRTSLSITRTAKRTRLRTGDEYTKQKKECLMQHSMEMEMAFLWSILTDNIGTNSKPERTMRGLIPFIRQYAPGNVDDFRYNATYSGTTWIQETGGILWLNTMLEQMFRYGSTEKFAFCGSGALLGLQRLAMAHSQLNITVGQGAYGIKVLEWITPFGTLYLKTHPLFSYDAVTRNMVVVFEPKKIKYRYIDDTTFYKDGEASHPGRGGGRLDATDEEFLTECSLEMTNPYGCGLLTGFNSDSLV